MNITRWQARMTPTKEILMELLTQEGLEPRSEVLAEGVTIKDHRHPLTEVLMVSEGEMLLNITGNQILLRAGDRIEIPPNTKHSYMNKSPGLCDLLVSYRI